MYKTMIFEPLNLAPFEGLCILKNKTILFSANFGKTITWQRYSKLDERSSFFLWEKTILCPALTSSEKIGFNELCDALIISILTWLHPRERLQLSRVSNLLSKCVYNFGTFEEVWLCNNPWLQPKSVDIPNLRFGFNTANQHVGYQNSVGINLLPFVQQLHLRPSHWDHDKQFGLCKDKNMSEDKWMDGVKNKQTNTNSSNSKSSYLERSQARQTSNKTSLKRYDNIRMLRYLRCFSATSGVSRILPRLLDSDNQAWVGNIRFLNIRPCQTNSMFVGSHDTHNSSYFGRNGSPYFEHDHETENQRYLMKWVHKTQQILNLFTAITRYTYV
ncbi:hypothetical protein RFI_11350 [Reticulomyxa filosa]|uniref:F-box domain-containing protein n=1 Tax=Reticulomyxa filosa TaxID=46433 RepID=X6NK93_RETFI|nr:hypothetical protein RFI_11350 [Reticulomyxa filosa]|eukprot:ETO25787.1 hypothetical protein RFI_11350 [Reticulomyxa filosa]